MDLALLPDWLAARYPLARPVTCTLLRSYTNDVYAVHSPGGRFVLKIYSSDWRTDPEIRYEIALIRHLAGRGLPVAAPVVGNNGDALQERETADGSHYAVQFVFAPGEKPRPPFTPPLYRAFGQVIARMHALSDDFTTEHPRPPLDLSLLLDAPLARAAPYFAHPKERDFLTGVAERVRRRIADLASTGLDWGPIHGDATLDNLHVTASGEIVLYDFDSGGPGWRAADLQGWAANQAEYREQWAAFLGGYSAVRPIRPADLAAAPYLTLAWDFWGIQIDLEQRILRQGWERTQIYLREQVARIRDRLRVLFGEDAQP